MKNKELVLKCKKEMTLRKKLHNELVDLKRNIRVYCRVLPVVKEVGGGKTAENVISFDKEDDGILYAFSKGANKPFENTHIRVYCRMLPVVKEVGSGKTAENVISFDKEDDGILYVFSKGANKPFEMDKMCKPE